MQVWLHLLARSYAQVHLASTWAISHDPCWATRCICAKHIMCASIRSNLRKSQDSQRCINALNEAAADKHCCSSSRTCQVPPESRSKTFRSTACAIYAALCEGEARLAASAHGRQGGKPYAGAGRPNRAWHRRGTRDVAKQHTI